MLSPDVSERVALLRTCSAAGASRSRRCGWAAGCRKPA